MLVPKRVLEQWMHIGSKKGGLPHGGRKTIDKMEHLYKNVSVNILTYNRKDILPGPYAASNIPSKARRNIILPQFHANASA